MEREGETAKFLLNPVRMQDSGGFRAHEIRRIQGLLIEGQEIIILNRWNECFSN